KPYGVLVLGVNPCCRLNADYMTFFGLIAGQVADLLHNSGSTVPAPRDALEMIHRNGLRLLKLVNNLLDFSRIEAGRAQAVYEPTDLSVVTTELASMFRSAVEKAGLQFVVNCPP